MAVVKVFDSKGVKTVELMGNVSEQGYDSVEEDEIAEDEAVNASDDSVDF